MKVIQILKAISPFASAIVAVIAIWIISKQSERNLQLSARHTWIEEAKLKSDLFDRRYDGWLAMRKAANDRYMAIVHLKPNECNPSSDLYKSEDQYAFNIAADRLFFLFGDDVSEAVNQLNGRLTAFHVAKMNEYSAEMKLSKDVRMVETAQAHQEVDNAY